jgi:glycosyltransferase involved in cell wall biosynthesis
MRVLACAFACCRPGTPGFRGGEDTLGWHLLKQIARFHEVWALTRAEDRPSIEQALEEDPDPNLHVCYVSLPRWLLPTLRIQGGHQLYYFFWQIKAFLVARKLHSQYRFELFHHVTYANDWLVSFIGALLPVRYIRGPGGGAHRTPKGFEREYTFSGRIWEKVRTLSQWILRHDPLFVRGHNRAGAILACNPEVKSSIPLKWSHKVHLFPVSGISSKDLDWKAPPRVVGQEFRVLSAGSLIRVKGFGLAIKAFREFANLRPDARFTIIGSGPEKPRLQNLIRRLQLESQVELVESIPRDELLSRMASCDVFLFPSLRDGGGTVVVEAMAVGKPVVCLDTGGPGMHITAECGFKIQATTPQRTIRELADTLEHLYVDEAARLDLGAAARQRAAQFYLWDRLGDRLKEIYEGPKAKAHAE